MNIVDFPAKTYGNKEKHLVARVKDALIQYSFIFFNNSVLSSCYMPGIKFKPASWSSIIKFPEPSDSVFPSNNDSNAGVSHWGIMEFDLLEMSL